MTDTDGIPVVRAARLAAEENGLAVVTTMRADGSVQSSVVNVAAYAHPKEGVMGLAFVTFGRVKLTNLRARPQVAVTFRRAGQWATVEGTAHLVGPDDEQPWFGGSENLRMLLRSIFTAAGGVHDDWDTYDRVMQEQRRAAVLITPTRIYSNPS